LLPNDGNYPDDPDEYVDDAVDVEDEKDEDEKNMIK